MWVRQWGVLANHGDAAGFADAYVRAGFTWAAIPVLAGERVVLVNRSPDHWQALRARGVALYAAWELPAPATWRAHIDDFLDTARTLGAVGLMPNPEREFVGSSHASEAAAFANALHAGAQSRGLELSVISYSTPQFHGGFPWSTFAAVADFGVSETYDRDMGFDASYFSRALEGWRAAGFRVVVPCASLYDHRDNRAKNREELEHHFAQVPRTGAVLVYPTVPCTRDAVALLTAWSVDPLAPRRSRRRGRGRTSRSASRRRRMSRARARAMRGSVGFSLSEDCYGH